MLNDSEASIANHILIATHLYDRFISNCGRQQMFVIDSSLSLRMTKRTTSALSSNTPQNLPAHSHKASLTPMAIHLK